MSTDTKPPAAAKSGEDRRHQPEGSRQPVRGRDPPDRQGDEADQHRSRRRRDPRPAEERADRQLPGPHGQREVPDVQGLPRPAQQHPRPVQGRHALPPRGQPRRDEGARVVDDLQERAPRDPVRRRQGRRQGRPAPAQQGRARAHHAAVHRGARLQHRPRLRHPRARREHQQPDHGLDDGHVHEHRRRRRSQHGARRRHRQERVVGRQPRPRRGHRPGRRPLHHRVGEGPATSTSTAATSSSRASATSAATPRACCRRRAR